MNRVKESILTEREFEIMQLLVKGYSNYKIAETLVISIHTVKAHIESIYRKLQVHNKVQAAIRAYSLNLIDINEY